MRQHGPDCYQSNGHNPSINVFYLTSWGRPVCPTKSALGIAAFPRTVKHPARKDFAAIEPAARGRQAAAGYRGVRV